ncbi:MAG: hypothetical protein ACM3NH_01180 [Candidatus Saccharibacteria bacterium]
MTTRQDVLKVERLKRETERFLADSGPPDNDKAAGLRQWYREFLDLIDSGALNDKLEETLYECERRLIRKYSDFDFLKGEAA